MFPSLQWCSIVLAIDSKTMEYIAVQKKGETRWVIPGGKEKAKDLKGEDPGPRKTAIREFEGETRGKITNQSKLVLFSTGIKGAEENNRHEIFWYLYRAEEGEIDTIIENFKPNTEIQSIKKMKLGDEKEMETLTPYHKEMIRGKMEIIQTILGL